MSRGCRAGRRPGCGDFDGGWFGLVHVPMASGNGLSELTMQLWLVPEHFTTEPPWGLRQ
ncbi:MAG: hypothetical protein AB7G47_19630 [Mycolicibacterium sp.]|uniref:hypothetical protein n=1 Tax=Mycolicibacterium sp. TaxID=2320850 RepID=UPI003D0C3FF1